MKLRRGSLQRARDYRRPDMFDVRRMFRQIAPDAPFTTWELSVFYALTTRRRQASCVAELRRDIAADAAGEDSE